MISLNCTWWPPVYPPHLGSVCPLPAHQLFIKGGFYQVDLDVCIYAPTVYTVNVHIAYISVCLSVPVILKAQFSNLKAFFVCYVKVIWGSVTRWIHFFRPTHFNETFCVCAGGFQGLLKAFHYPMQFLSFYSLLWNYFLILKMLTETLLRISFSVIGRCSLVQTSHWLQGKCARITLAFSVSKSLLSGLWSGLLEGFSKLVSNFKGAKLKLWVWFYHQQRNKKL